MIKRITADHVKLKRAYEPAAANDGTRILIDRLWPCGGRKQTLRSISGSRISPRAQPCENGSVTTRSVGRSFAAGTPQRFTSIPNSLTYYGPWQDRARSLSCSRLTMNFITTRLRCGIFFWAETRRRPRRLIDKLLEENEAYDGLG